MLTRNDGSVSNGPPNGLNGTPNGWGRLIGLIGIPGAISLYLVWWLTQSVGAKLDRMIFLLEHIARMLDVRGS